MTENVGQSHVDIPVSERILQIKKNVENQYKELKSLLGKKTDSLKEHNKALLDTLEKQTQEALSQLEDNFQTGVKDNKETTDETLEGLRESLDGQLDSLRGFATKLFDDEEERLVNTLESSISHVSGVTKDHSTKLKSIIEKINELAKSSTNSPLELIKINNESLKTDLTNQLQMQNEDLVGSMVDLQIEFREKIGTQIEKVFMGVTVTKGSLDGIIKDTLSRLEENLNLLHAGIDNNFTKEIGVTQDLIHNYEGKLLLAIENTKVDYNELMSRIINRNADQLLENLESLQKTLNVEKEKVFAQVKDLTKEQQDLVKISLDELESQVVNSKAQVIDSHGVLKDDLDKLLASNSQTVKEMIKNAQKENQLALSVLNKQIAEYTVTQKATIEAETKTSRQSILEQIDSLKTESQQSVDNANKGLKDLEELTK